MGGLSVSGLAVAVAAYRQLQKLEAGSSWIVEVTP
jgi:hypothetical protein